jgi:hypothetical protein
MLLVTAYGCKPVGLHLKEEPELIVGNKELWRIFGPKRESSRRVEKIIL